MKGTSMRRATTGTLEDSGTELDGERGERSDEPEETDVETCCRGNSYSRNCLPWLITVRILAASVRWYVGHERADDNHHDPTDSVDWIRGSEMRRKYIPACGFKRQSNVKRLFPLDQVPWTLMKYHGKNINRSLNVRVVFDIVSR